MRFAAKEEALVNAKTDVLVVGIFSGPKGMDASAKAVDRKLKGALKDATSFADFDGGLGKTLFVPATGLAARRVLAVGLGDPAEFDAQAALRAGACAAKECSSARLSSMALIPFRARRMNVRDAAAATAEGIGRACYDPGIHHTQGKAKRPKFVSRIQFCAKSASELSLVREGARRGEALAEGVNFTRDLINEPSNELTPRILARKAKALAKSSPLLSCRVWGEKEILRREMGGLYGVGKGSDEPSQFIHLEYRPRGSQRGVKTIALVGKGITFDTGGISIKPSANMELMKFDMGGAAAVLGAFHLLAALKPRIRVLGYVAAAENMPSGKALKPGDLLRMMNGMTVEVNNTDAEGRLVLADAIHYAKSQKPEFIVDAATLTGACMIALGDVACGLMTEDDDLAKLILDAGKSSGDPAWRLPLQDAHREQMKGHVADLINTGPREGGALNAAGFLSYFAKGVRWAHLDIAGTVWADRAKDDNPKGGTGFGARLFYSIAEKASG